MAIFRGSKIRSTYISGPEDAPRLVTIRTDKERCEIWAEGDRLVVRVEAVVDERFQNSGLRDGLANLKVTESESTAKAAETPPKNHVETST